MAYIDTDVRIMVYQSAYSSVVGQHSIYTSEVHPGSNKKIQGWQWDRRTWPVDREFQATDVINTLWDPTTSGIADELWQSGYGDDDDLELKTILPVRLDDWDYWVPKIHTGFFYDYENEWYLFSDEYQNQDFWSSHTVSGMQYVDLLYDPKPIFPIQVRRFRYDKVQNKHYVDIEFRKVVELTVSGSPEFQVDSTNYSPPRIWLNAEWSEEIGSVAGATPTVSEVSGLESVGFSTGDEDQQFHLVYSPVVRDKPISIWSYSDAGMLQDWTVISGVDEFTTSGYEVWVDYERGVVAFGDDSQIPPAGDRIVANYWAGQTILYEPEFATEYVLSPNADLNPLSALSKGFVQVRTGEFDAASIVLTSSLVLEGSSYIINVGNNIGRFAATVKDTEGTPLEGQIVTFELIEPTVGTFGSATESSSATGADGKAYAIYSPPSSVDDIGVYSTDVTIGGNATLVFDGLFEPENVSGVWLYKVWETDVVLGMPESDLTSYYTDYITDNDLDNLPSTASGIAYEIAYRGMHGIETPVTYGAADISTGRKTIVTTSGVDIIDPRTGTFTGVASSPKYPDSATNTGTDLEPELTLVYTPASAIDDIAANGTKSYFAVTEQNVSVRAYTTNQRTGQRLYSNTVDINIVVPESGKGTLYVDDLEDVASGLLYLPRDIDTVGSAEIEATQSNWNSTYLEEREGTYKIIYYPREVDDDTVTLWHLDDLTDSSGNGLDLNNYGATYTPSGLVDGAYEITASGQYMIVSGVMATLSDNGASGTFETYYKCSMPDLGTKYKVIFDAEWGGASVSNRAWFGILHQSNQDYLRFQAMYRVTAGEWDDGGDPADLRVVFPIRDDLLDWHHYKFIWSFSEIDPSPGETIPSGYKMVYVYIDDEEIASYGPTLTFGPVAADTVDSMLIGGPDPSWPTVLPAEGVYDEMRILDTASFEDTGLTVSGLRFTGETYIDWFSRTHKADSQTLGLTEVSVTQIPGDLPLGWRLKSDSITLASAIDQITYVNPNEYLVSGYYE